MKNKKSLVMTDVIVWFGLALLVFFVISTISPNLLGKGSREVSKSLSLTKDYDNDGIMDYFDKCACDSGDEKNDGCPAGTDVRSEAAVKKEKDCRDKILGNK